MGKGGRFSGGGFKGGRFSGGGGSFFGGGGGYNPFGSRPPRRSGGSGFFWGWLLGRSLSKNQNNVYINEGGIYDGGKDNNSSAAPNAPLFVQCKYCGSKYNMGTVKCKNCGASIEQVAVNRAQAETAPDTQVQQNARRRSNKIVAALIVLFAALFILVIALSFVTKTVNLEIGEQAETKWFNFTVTNLTAADCVNSNYAPAGYKFVVADITLKNTYGQAIPMYENDFLLLSKYSNGSQKEIMTEKLLNYGYSAFVFQLYDNTARSYYFNLAAGETKSGKLIFLAASGAENYTLSYTEYDDDGNKGATYNISVPA